MKATNKITSHSFTILPTPHVARSLWRAEGFQQKRPATGKLLAAVIFSLVLNASAAEFYIDASGGATFASDYEPTLTQPLGIFPAGTTGTKVKFDLGTGYGFNLDFGAKITEELSVGLSTGYTELPLNGVTVGGVTAPISGEDVTIVPMLAFIEGNGALTEKLSVKFGLGLGVAFITALSEDATAFNVQLRTGIEYKLTDNCSAGFAYRFGLLTDPSFEGLSGGSVNTHFIGASLKFSF